VRWLWSHLKLGIQVFCASRLATIGGGFGPRPPGRSAGLNLDDCDSKISPGVRHLRGSVPSDAPTSCEKPLFQGFCAGSRLYALHSISRLFLVRLM
jgi:hypothetical protein